MHQWLIGSLLAGAALLGGCVGQPSRSSETSGVTASHEGAGQYTADELRRASLMRPLESGIDVPITHTSVNGYVMVDAADYSDKALGSENLALRRFDLNYKQPLWHDALIYIDTQLIDGSFELKDAYFRMATHALGVLTLGNQQEPFGLEQFGSFKNTTFLERATTNALAPSRSVGISSHDFAGSWVWGYGFFGGGPPDEGHKQRGTAFTGRIAYVLHTDGGLYHLALEYSKRKFGSGDVERLDSPPEVSLSTGDKFLDTHNLKDPGILDRHGAEAAYLYGPISWQAEYMTTHLQRHDGLPPLRFYGWYAYFSWMLTGERRDYKESDATFGSVTPRYAWDGRRGGALELGLRLSSTDLNDRDVEGGKETNVTLGLNWYLDKSLRLSLNLVHALDLEKPDHQYDGKHPTALVGRFQYQF